MTNSGAVKSFTPLARLSRHRLLAGTPVDLRSVPANVTWVPLDGMTDRERRLEACLIAAPSADGSVLIIGDSRYPREQRRFASLTPGAVTESVDLRDPVNFARGFDLRHPSALGRIVEFADELMSGIGAPNFLAQVASHQSGTAPAPPKTAAVRSKLRNRMDKGLVGRDHISESSPVGHRLLRIRLLGDTHEPAIRSCWISEIRFASLHHMEAAKA
jgi:hypothetical protein